VTPGRRQRREALFPLAVRTAAVTSLALICAGVPLWLAALGGLPFAHVDPMAPFRAAAGHGGDARTVASWLGQIALVVGWAAWAWTVTCIVLEARYWLSGRAPAHLPGSRSVQWMVAALVGTAFALGGLARSPHDLHPVGPQAPGGRVAASAAPRSAAPRSAVPRSAGPWSPVPRPPGPRSPVPRSPVPPAGDVVPAPPSGPGGPRSGSITWHGQSAVTVSDPEVPGAGTEPGGDAEPVPSASSPAGSGIAVAPVSTGIHLVGDRETLWSVADHRLGSPRRWREIAALNYDRPQPDGGRLTTDHWIRPGWQLLLPPSAIDRSGPVPGSEPDPWSGGREGKTVPPPTPPPRAATPSTTTTTTDQGSERGAVPGGRGFPSRPRTPGVPVIPVGAGIVGVGVSDLVDRLRRVQQRHREPGARIRLPDPILRQFEQRLRLGDGADVLRSVEEAVSRYFGHGDSPVPSGVVLGVKVSGADVELVIDGGDTSAEPPRGFRRVPGTSSLAIDRSSLGTWPGSVAPRVPRPGRPRSFPLPTLVTIGRSEDCVVLVNLEGLGSLVVDGDLRDAEGIARATALELATSRWSSRFDLVLVGFGVDLERLDRVAVTSATGPLASDLSWRRLRDAVRLEDRGFASVTEARSRDHGEPWDPVVVICGPGVPPDDLEALLALGGGGTDGIAVLAVAQGTGDLGSVRCVRARPGGGAPSLEVLGELLEPQRVSAEEVESVVRLLEVAAPATRTGDADTHGHGHASAPDVPGDGPDDGPDDGPGDGPGHPRCEVPVPTSSPTHASVEPVPEGPGPGPAVPAFLERGTRASLPVGSEVDRPERPAVGPDPAVRVTHPRGADADPPAIGPSPAEAEVEIAVLGPVDIRGAAREFTRAWSRELVVYLALHPDGASNDVWATALWPERVMAPSSLHSTASVARRSLGKARDGSDHLPRSHGRLALGPSVGTDWDRFVALAGQDDPRAWTEALGLVRGRPFDGLRSTDWTVLDGTAPTIESSIVDLSGRLAGACLRSGDPRGAEWAARRGLVVSPYDERLYRMLLRAADAAGNPGGVESVMAELVRVVADEIEPLESVHPSTLELYRSLSRRRVTAV